MGVRFKYST